MADAELGADPRNTMTRMLAGLTVPKDGSAPDMAGLAAADGRGFVDRMPEVKELPAWLSQEELDHYVEEFSRTGFTGGINWYRNFDRNWETTPQLADAKVEVPSAFITGADDPVGLMSPTGMTDGYLTDHRGNTVIPDAGHWVQQEKPAETNAALLSFLSSLDLGGR